VDGTSLLLDYIMTVSVSISAGVAAVYSAFPTVFVLRVPMAVLVVWLIAWGNLRGVRTTGRLFAAPTYLFVSSIVGLVLVGGTQLLAGRLHSMPAPAHLRSTASAVTILVLLHAYASGTSFDMVALLNDLDAIVDPTVS